jgi:hypothetical protein
MSMDVENHCYLSLEIADEEVIILCLVREKDWIHWAKALSSLEFSWEYIKSLVQIAAKLKGSYVEKTST